MLKNLRLLREESGMSQRQLADRIGVSQQSINKYENHNVEPDIGALIRMATAFPPRWTILSAVPKSGARSRRRPHTT